MTPPPATPADSGRSSPEPRFQRGQIVRVPALRMVGVVLAIHRERRLAEVDLSGKTWTLPLDQLEPASSRDLPRDRPSRPPVPTQHTLDLHGLRVEDALEAVDKFIDSAIVNELETVKLIHGHGSGRVRDSVRDLLRRHPHVEDFQFGAPWQGGPGATIVRLKRG